MRSIPFPRQAFGLSLLSVLLGSALECATAQSNSTILPAGFDRLPGNAAISMPIRWSSGRMQIIYDDRQLAPLDGFTITRLRLRRPGFFDERAYAAGVQRTFEIAIGPAGRTSQLMASDVTLNLPAAGMMTTVFGPSLVTIPGSPTAAEGDTVGPVLIDIPLSQPYTVQVVPGEHLLIDWKCLDGSLDVVAGGWIDAVRMPGGARIGLAVPVGQFGCGGVGAQGNAATPNRLDVDESDRNPAFGRATTVVLQNAQAGSRVWLAIALDAQAMTAPALYGQPITSLPVPTAPGTCRAWAPLDFFLIDIGTTSVGGSLRYDLDLPTSTFFHGMQLDLQALILETPPQLAFSNGLVLWMDDIGLGGQISSNLTLTDAVDSSWGSFIGTAPVIEFVH